MKCKTCNKYSGKNPLAHYWQEHKSLMISRIKKAKLKKRGQKKITHWLK